MLLHDNQSAALPLLSVTIPTYNRRSFLQQTLGALLPQAGDDIEVLVCDNCSTDDTWEYLSSLKGTVRSIRHETNIGLDRNMISCIEHAQGQYVWILCDDDLPCKDTVSQIRQAIAQFDSPPMLFLSSKWSNDPLTELNQIAYGTNWSLLDRDSFLDRVTFWFTVASSIVVRRDCVNSSFVNRWIGSILVPAAITLSTVGIHNQVAVPDGPLVICRGGNSGGYGALKVFTTNVLDLLKACVPLGYDRAVLDRTYEENLKGVVSYVINDWPIDADGVKHLVTSSYRYRNFYRVALPKLMRRALTKLRAKMGLRVRARFREVRDAVQTKRYLRFRESLDQAAAKAFVAQIKNVGPGCRVRHPYYLRNPQRIQIGKGFSAQAGLRIEAWDACGDRSYDPRIVIGDDVIMNYNVHIGAISTLKIGNSVLVGSHVLITDHSHGSLTADETNLPAASRPLYSKGSVTIEDNVWIGEGVCILAGVTVGKNAVIGANSVVTQDVPSGWVVGGVPAKPLFKLEDR